MALYHTHRPQSFADIAGQNHIINTITNQVSAGKIAHAYLFSGPRGVGKTTLARIIAKAINCPKIKGSDFEPDNTCPDALAITEGKSIDVIEIDAASNTGVDNVRENIIDNVQFRPTKLAYKVFIIDEVHMLSTSAFNALLKTLEEPPDHAVFILATTELHKIPKTIVSRCQLFHFEKLDFQTLKSHLEKVANAEKVTLEPSVYEKIIYRSDGCARDAVNLLDQILATGEKNITSELATAVLPASHAGDILTLIASLVKNDLPGAISALKESQNNNTNAHFYYNELLEVLRSIMILMANPSATPSILTQYDEVSAQMLEEITEKTTLTDVLTMIDIFLERKKHLPLASTAFLPLEMAAVQICHHSEPTATPKTQITPKKETTHKISTEPTQGPEKETVLQKEETSKPQQIQQDESPSSPPKADDVSFDLVRLKWKNIVSDIEKDAPSLSLILQNSQLVSIKGNTLILGVAFALHQDKLGEIQTKSKVESAIESHCNAKITLETQIIKQDTPSEDISGLAALVGGEVV